MQWKRLQEASVALVSTFWLRIMISVQDGLLQNGLLCCGYYSDSNPRSSSSPPQSEPAPHAYAALWSSAWTAWENLWSPSSVAHLVRQHGNLSHGTVLQSDVIRYSCKQRWHRQCNSRCASTRFSFGGSAAHLKVSALYDCISLPWIRLQADTDTSID
jgi:hypothetical protein